VTANSRIAARAGGTDCGFGTFVGWSGCDPKAAWLKLEALAQGARIASDRLWKH
jgi:5-methyltetrahydropteroyltriglutamate--homocysteine methyltransferase